VESAAGQAINKELHKRPSSTGVRYHLQWQPLGEDEGAPVGLEAARTRLLNTGADLWSIEDRRVVGAMQQQRIAAGREHGDADPGPHTGDGGGSLRRTGSVRDCGVSGRRAPATAALGPAARATVGGRCAGDGRGDFKYAAA